MSQTVGFLSLFSRVKLDKCIRIIPAAVFFELCKTKLEQTAAGNIRKQFAKSG